MICHTTTPGAPEQRTRLASLQTPEPGREQMAELHRTAD